MTHTSNIGKNILVADDDSLILNLLDVMLAERNGEIEMRRANSGEAVIRAINEKKPDVLVLDIKMYNGDGFSVLDYIQKNDLAIPVVVLTNYRKEKYAERCQILGVKEYIVKAEMQMDWVVNVILNQLSQSISCKISD